MMRNSVPTSYRDTLSIFVPAVPHVQFCTWKCTSLFPLIDRLACTIQRNQTLDAWIRYVA